MLETREASVDEAAIIAEVALEILIVMVGNQTADMRVDNTLVTQAFRLAQQYAKEVDDIHDAIEEAYPKIPVTH